MRSRVTASAVRLLNVVSGAAFVFAVLSGATVTAADVEWVAGWKETSPMNEPRAGAAAVAHNRFIYVMGGVDGRRFLDSAEYAPILADGSLGAWRYTSALPAPRGFTDAVVYDGYVYVVGGGNGPHGGTLLQTVLRAPILRDGRLGPWQQEPQAMLIPRRCSKLVLARDTVFSLGGYGGTLLDSVERTGIGRAGHLTGWRMEPQTMTMPRYVNAVKSVNGRVYVLGGHHPDQGGGLAEVEWASLGGDALTWRATTPLQQGRYALAAATHGDWLYALGGISGAEYLSSVEKTRVNHSGTLDGWHTSTPLSRPMASFSSVTYGGRIYILGGATRDGYRNTTEFAVFDANGDTGFPATPSEASAYRQRRAQEEAGPRLPNEAVVVETIQTSAYTYIHVQRAAQATWLAAPKMRLVPGAVIRYSQGVYMSNFFSKELKRSFAGILFVGNVQVIEQ